MKSKLYRLLYLLTNIGVSILNIFIHRDKQVWLFGAWMGNRFSDNPRYLFQYVNENKDTLSIKKVIWVTRSAQVYSLLEEAGYNVYLCGTLKSFYWHIKAGVHVVCDIPNKTAVYSGDIDGLLSWGATKLQTWHGVGIKACGRLKNDSLNYKGIRFNKNFRHYFYPGGWDKCYWLVTSKEDARAKSLDFGLDESQLIVSCYPRNCMGLKCFENEQTIIDHLHGLRNRGNTLVIYLPTFRSKDDENAFIAPIQIEGFLRFIEAHNIIWIEKRHSASTYHADKVLSPNVLYIESDFDVNLIYECVDVVVSDYSSSISDALAKDLRVLHYVPDYEHYTKEDRGFVADYYSYHPGIVVKCPAGFLSALEETVSNEYFTQKRLRNYKRCKALLFDDRMPEMKNLCHQIISRFGK